MPITKALFLAAGPYLGAGNGSRAKLAEKLEPVKSAFSDAAGILAVSVKWRPFGKFQVNKTQAPAVVGDGLTSYAAEGSPELAESIGKAADAAGLWAEATDSWGLDEGHLLPLSILFPDAGLPVVPVSLSQMSPEAHRKWGVTLKRAAQKWNKPLALIITGSFSSRPDLTAESPEILKLQKFDDDIALCLACGKLGEFDLMDRNLFKAAQPEGGWGSLFCLWGAIGENVPSTQLFYERPMPGMAAGAFLFEPALIPKTAETPSKL